MQTEAPFIRLSVIFNNVPFDTQLKTSWGFSCFIESKGHTILFDTGGDGNILIDNMKRMGIDLTAVDLVFLSHIHADHTGGLERLLEHDPHVTVYLPESFSASFKQGIENLGANVKAVGKAVKLSEGVYSTGEMGGWIKEQALILETSMGLVIITGCAHPGVVDMVKKAMDLLKKDIYLVMGGFHLAGMTSIQIGDIIHMLKNLGVQKVAPSHCTGEEALALFKEAWGEGFLEGCVGAIVEFSR